MAVARPYGFEIDFVRIPISGSAAWFFVIILKFIFTAIYTILGNFWKLKKIKDELDLTAQDCFKEAQMKLSKTLDSCIKMLGMTMKDWLPLLKFYSKNVIILVVNTLDDRILTTESLVLTLVW